MLRRKFVVSCFGNESDTLEFEGAVLAPTAADAVIEFFRMEGLGRPSLPLRIEQPQIDADHVVKMWSLSAAGIGLRVWVKERIGEESETDILVSGYGGLLN